MPAETKVVDSKREAMKIVNLIFLYRINSSFEKIFGLRFAFLPKFSDRSKLVRM